MNLTKLPENLPEPIDDGVSDHLLGLSLPSISLVCTNGNKVDISKLNGRQVIFIYPMTGRPDVDLPEGWNEIPGARGCTPQSCSFRDLYSEFKLLDTEIFGLSTQSSEYQQEVLARLHLPFQLLSDSSLHLKNIIGLPTFNVGDMELYKRITLITEDAHIKKVFYPVYPADRNAELVLNSLRSNDN
jgi:peroxiredoxin